jgi:hypothetical protein
MGRLPSVLKVFDWYVCSILVLGGLAHPHRNYFDRWKRHVTGINVQWRETAAVQHNIQYSIWDTLRFNTVLSVNAILLYVRPPTTDLWKIFRIFIYYFAKRALT